MLCSIFITPFPVQFCLLACKIMLPDALNKFSGVTIRRGFDELF
jgi:hypothetical protein